MIKSIKKHRRQIVLFFIAGAISAFIQISLMLFFIEAINFQNSKLNYFISSILSTSGGILSNYFLNVRYVFKRGKHSKRKEFYLFFILSVITAILTWLISSAFQAVLDENYLKVIIISSQGEFSLNIREDIAVSQTLTIFIISMINYVIKKKFVFSN